MGERGWVWEPFDPNHSSASGDIAKMFRNEEIKSPGVLARGAPPSVASVMAREVIQNSWDAAAEEAQRSTPPPPFDLMFEFREVSGAEKERFATALGLQDLANRLVACGEHAKLGLRAQLCLDELDDPNEPLRYMLITETGTTGMYGGWKSGDSRMYLALATLGYTPKPDGGGSYGYGKAGLIRGSATHTVLAYSCFRPTSDDDGVTRRLFGMTYWGQHQINGTAYPGFARFGRETEGAVVPFDDDEADRVANDLGLALRDPSSGKGFGTTFLIVEPTVKPDDLLHAIERNWWPALEDRSIQFDVSVVSDGAPQRPRPKKQEELRPFVEAYDLARMPEDNRHPHKKRVPLKPVGGYSTPGVLGLIADPGGWSYPNRKASSADDQAEHRSLVALMRNPRMVVEYLEAGQTQPFVRGAFVAGESIDEMLRRTEPKAHDAWQTKPDEDMDPEASSIAKTVLSRVTTNVRTFRDSLKPAKPQREQLMLPEWERLMKLFQKPGTKPVPPSTDTREVTISPHSEIERVGSGEIRATGHASIGLSEHHKAESALVDVRIQYRLVEDDRVGDHIELSIDPPRAFKQVPGTDYYRGIVHRGHDIQVDFESESYDSIWSCKLIVDAEIATDAGS